MSEPYQELIEGESVLRLPPGPRHELICARLHECVRAGVRNLVSTRLMPPRSEILLSLNIKLCPDLALVTTSTGKLWLAAEIISSDDHRNDTVIKKEMYEQLKLPRLWMIDPRYDNIEVYHGSPYGLMLKAMLAGSEILAEELLPEFQLIVADLFQMPQPQS